MNAPGTALEYAQQMATPTFPRKKSATMMAKGDGRTGRLDTRTHSTSAGCGELRPRTRRRHMARRTAPPADPEGCKITKMAHESRAGGGNVRPPESMSA